jgi:hypothetical protein
MHQPAHEPTSKQAKPTTQITTNSPRICIEQPPSNHKITTQSQAEDVPSQRWAQPSQSLLLPHRSHLWAIGTYDPWAKT